MVQKLFQELATIPNVQAIALGGSRAGDNFDINSDYDVYVYCQGQIPHQTRQQILQKYCKYMEIGNRFWESEDNCKLSNGIDIDILYRNLDDFVNQVAWVVEKFNSCNGYTTCMWHNLLTCKIVYDKQGLLANAKKRFSVDYPPQLRANIIDNNTKLLYRYLPNYLHQIQKAQGRSDTVSVCHRTAAFMESYFDVLFAYNNLTHPGEKRLLTLCKQWCKVLPHNFEQNIDGVFQNLFTNPSQANHYLNQMVAELQLMLQDNK